jgi:hypothetical protein
MLGLGGMAQAMEHLPSVHKAWVPSSEKKEGEERRGEGKVVLVKGRLPSGRVCTLRAKCSDTSCQCWI